MLRDSFSVPKGRDSEIPVQCWGGDSRNHRENSEIATQLAFPLTPTLSRQGRGG